MSAEARAPCACAQTQGMLQPPARQLRGAAPSTRGPRGSTSPVRSLQPPRKALGARKPPLLQPPHKAPGPQSTPGLRKLPLLAPPRQPQPLPRLPHPSAAAPPSASFMAAHVKPAHADEFDGGDEESDVGGRPTSGRVSKTIALMVALACLALAAVVCVIILFMTGHVSAGMT